MPARFAGVQATTWYVCSVSQPSVLPDVDEEVRARLAALPPYRVVVLD